MALDIQGQTWIDWMHASTPLIIDHREMIDRWPRVMPLKLSIFLLMELSNLGSRLNKCSYRSMEVKLPALLGNYDRPTNQPTNWLTGPGKGRHGATEEVSYVFHFALFFWNHHRELWPWIDQGEPSPGLGRQRQFRRRKTPPSRPQLLSYDLWICLKQSV